MAFIPVASFPAVQRDLYLSRCVRRDEDAPRRVDTMCVRWDDMVVGFASDASVSEASVEVREDISLVTFTRRLESLLDCGAKSEGAEWVLKYSARLSAYGNAATVRRLLCDKVASLDSSSGETVGVMKIKRRSVTAGHAKVRLVPGDDSLQLIVRHQTAQGLKAVWKSVLWRLRPQYPTGQKEPVTTLAEGVTVKKTWAPGVWVKEEKGGYHYSQAANWLSEQGRSVDLSQDIDVLIPISEFRGKEDLPSTIADYYCRVEVQMDILPARKPVGISITNGVIEIKDYRRSCLEQMRLVSNWLGLGWKIPAPPPAAQPERRGGRRRR